MKKTNMWFLERLRGSGEKGTSRGVGGEAGEKASKGSLYSNVLMPDKIPDFFIPPKLHLGSAEAEGQAELGQSSSEQNLVSAGPHKTPRRPRLPAKLAAESKSLLKAATRHVIQIESAEDWLAEEATNADPQAQGAMSLPSVPTAQTSYGFATLTESPHTRRKESLFHREHGALSQVGSPGAGRRRAAARANGSDGGSREAGGTLMSPSHYFSGGESDTGSSAGGSVSLLKGFAQDGQAKVTQLKHSVAGHGSLSADDSTPDTSPGVRRRLTRRATPEPGPEASQVPGGEHTVWMGMRGSVRLLAKYEAAQARLRVRLLAAEDLYDRPCDARSINCCVGLCLVPGKLQKQRSTIIKSNPHPVFNEDFFDGLGPASVQKLALRINQGGQQGQQPEAGHPPGGGRAAPDHPAPGPVKSHLLLSSTWVVSCVCVGGGGLFQQEEEELPQGSLYLSLVPLLCRIANTVLRVRVPCAQGSAGFRAELVSLAAIGFSQP